MEQLPSWHNKPTAGVRASIGQQVRHEPKLTSWLRFCVIDHAEEKGVRNPIRLSLCRHLKKSYENYRHKFRALSQDGFESWVLCCEGIVYCVVVCCWCSRCASSSLSRLSANTHPDTLLKHRRAHVFTLTTTYYMTHNMVVVAVFLRCGRVLSLPCCFCGSGSRGGGRRYLKLKICL